MRENKRGSEKSAHQLCIKIMSIIKGTGSCDGASKQHKCNSSNLIRFQTTGSTSNKAFENHVVTDQRAEGPDLNESF